MSLEEEHEKLQEEYQKDLVTLRQLEEEIHVLHQQIMKQSEFSYRMASALGDYLNKASVDSATVAAMVTDASIEQLVNLFKQTVIQVTKRGLTKKSEEDSVFTLSLFSVFINMSKHEEGKKYILASDLHQITDLLIKVLLTKVQEIEEDKVHTCSFMDNIKLSAMEILNALSECPEGAAKLSSQEVVYGAIMQAVHAKTWNPIRKPALHFLQKLLASISEEHIYALAMAKLTPLDHIGNLQMSSDEEIRAAAESVIKNFHEAEARIRTPRDGDEAIVGEAT